MIRKFALAEAVRYGVCSILSALCVPVTAVLIERCINSAAGGNERDMAVSLGALAAALFLTVLTAHALRRSEISIGEAFTKLITPQIIDKLKRMRYSYYDDASAADVMERISRDPAEALSRLYRTCVSCIALAVRIFGVSLLYFDLSPLFGAALCGLMVIEIIIGILSNREFNRLYGAELPKERKLAYIGGLMYRKGSVFDLKVNRSVGYVKKLQKELADSLLRERVGINLKAERYYIINLILMTAWTAALLAALIKGRMAGTLGLGAFCTLLGSYPLLTGYQSELSYYLSSVGKDFIIIDALRKFFDFEETEGSEELTVPPAGIVFDHVFFKYPGTEEYVLRDISFTLSPGETVALVGANGSGKSTIIKLICGLYEPADGTVTVNGVPIHKLSGESRRKLYSAVFQDFLSYSVTIEENVALGDVRELHNRAKIWDALKKAGMDGFVSALPKGASTHLGHLEEDGIELSGGQSQRLAIARAYMSDACFFLLDEPTAAMDPIAESRLYQSFAGIIRGKGAVLVSHRLASAEIADRILVLKDGEIVQRGTHSELINSEGPYKEMFMKQSSWYTEAGAV